jgi:hypothetical protein
MGVGWNADPTLESKGRERSWTLRLGGRTRNKSWEQEWGEELTLNAGLGLEANLPEEKCGRLLNHSWDYGWLTKLNCPTFLGEELTSQSCGWAATQQLPGENSNISDHLGWSGGEKPQTSIVTCLIGRRNQLLLTTQPSCETTSEILSAPDGPSGQGKQDWKDPQQIPLNCLTKRGRILHHTAQNINLEKREDAEKAPVIISISAWI